ncbi:hypothetical protein ACOME3_000744 [Neoechinorhynchus agilis]
MLLGSSLFKHPIIKCGYFKDINKCTLLNLTADILFTFELFATNRLGEGGRSSVVCKTKKTVPFMAPSDFNAEFVKYGHQEKSIIVLEWVPISEHSWGDSSLIERKYGFEYTLDGMQWKAEKINRWYWSQTSDRVRAIIKFNETFKSFHGRMYAISSIGVGPSTQEISIKEGNCGMPLDSLNRKLLIKILDSCQIHDEIERIRDIKVEAHNGSAVVIYWNYNQCSIELKSITGFIVIIH